MSLARVSPRIGAAFSGRKPAVLHVSADFPDPVDPGKTAAIRTLVDLASEDFTSTVLSLNRTARGLPGLAADLARGGGAPRLARPVSRLFKHGYAVTYSAPSRGLYLHTYLSQLGDWIAAWARQAGVPDLIVGHKLTVEGVAVHRAAQELGLPYMLTLQGDTDTKILAARPDLRSRYRQIFHGADHVISFAPWALTSISKMLGERERPVAIIPAPSEVFAPIAPKAGSESLVSVFHLANWKRKNLAGTVKAFAGAAKDRPRLTLDIVGGGSAADTRTAQRIAAGVPGIAFSGHLERETLAARMNSAAGLVLPSWRESFGMVFIEALFAGCPVIYPRDRAISGFFDDMPFALPVDPARPGEIAQAMTHLLDNQDAIKRALANWQASGAALRFRKPDIGKRYRTALHQALANGSVRDG